MVWYLVKNSKNFTLHWIYHYRSSPFYCSSTLFYWNYSEEVSSSLPTS